MESSQVEEFLVSSGPDIYTSDELLRRQCQNSSRKRIKPHRGQGTALFDSVRDGERVRFTTSNNSGASHTVMKLLNDLPKDIRTTIRLQQLPESWSVNCIEGFREVNEDDI